MNATVKLARRATPSLTRVTPVLLIAAAFAAASAVATAHERVRPSAHPSHPSQSERVVIRFRARETLDGVYYAQVRHRPKEPGCDAQESRVVPAPSKGRVVRLTPSPESRRSARRAAVVCRHLSGKGVLQADPAVPAPDPVRRQRGGLPGLHDLHSGRRTPARDMIDTARSLFAIAIGACIAGAGLYLRSKKMSGDLTPLTHFALIGVGALFLSRGLRAFGRERD